MKLKIINKEYENNCFFCNNRKNILIADVIDVPLVLGCTIQKNNEDKTISYQVFKCSSCELIFTNANLDEIAYASIHSEAVGNIWKEHHKKFYEFILQENNFKDVLEIGPSNNPIMRVHTTFLDMMEKPPFQLKGDEKYIRTRFPETKLTEKYDMIVASHVFEHSINPKKFLEKCRDILKVNGKIFLSIPNFEIWINEKFWNGITPEHQIYPTKIQISEICNDLKLKVDFFNFQNHSVFLKIEKNENKNEKYKNEINIIEWFNSINDSINYVENELSKFSTQEVFLAGASHLSQYPILISDEIRKRIQFVLDNSKEKHEKRLYGTNCYCKPFEYIKKIESPLIIIFNSPYQNEMIEQIMKLNPKVQIINSNFKQNL
jgi:predicted SAM-dependent methyltransferase